MASCGTSEGKRGRGQEASLGGFMGSLRKLVGALWDAFLRPLGPLFGHLGGLLGPLGASWEALGASGGLLETSWGFLGAS